jgi:peptidyl-prolyl cis-trans isomerase D
MGAIGSIRKRSGLLIGVIGLALLAFILTDFFTKNNSRGIKNLGEVDGEVISTTMFDSKVNENTENYKVQNGLENLTTEITYQIKESTWEEMVRQMILGLEYDELGLTVTVDEVDDMLRGKFVHPFVLQNFTNPETGMFNPQDVTNTMSQLEQNPELKQQWDALVEYIKADRLFTKYQTLVTKAYYVPKAFAEREYVNKNRTANVELIAVKYSTISDSAVSVTDADFEAYYEEHKHEYYQETEVRSIDYVVFDVVPSDKDREEINAEVNELIAEIDTLNDNEDIISFINTQSDELYDSTWFKREELIPQFDTLFEVEYGTPIGPFIVEDVYHYAKLLNKEARPDSLKAAHVLIAYQGAYNVDPEITRTKEEAESMADSLLSVIKGLDSTAFSALAISLSDDQSAAQNGGYFDWFPDGMMVPEFNEACVNNAINSYTVTETVFGYHIIKVIDKTENINKIRYAHYQREIIPSDETYDNQYLLASEFAGQNQDLESFEKAIIDNEYNKRTAENLKAMDFSIPGMEDGRQFVRWAYGHGEDIEVGTVAPVFDDERKYVVTILTSIREVGTIPLEKIKEDIRPFVLIEKKADILGEKVNKLSGTPLNQMASKLNVQLDTIDAVSYATYSLPGYGPEPKVVGTVFATAAQQTTKVIRGNGAVFVIKVNSYNEPEAMQDYTPIVMQKLNFFYSRVNYDLYNSIKKNTEIVDNRIFFY